MKKMLAILISICTFLILPVNNNTFAANRQIGVQVVFVASELGTYGVPNAFHNRYDYYSGRVYTFYRAMWEIRIDFKVPASGNVVISCVDSCLSGNSTYDAFCTHTTNTLCNNLGSLHHTNAQVIKNYLYPNPRPLSNYADLYVTSTRICSKNSGVHNSLNGICFTTDKCMLVRDTDYTKSYYSSASLDMYYVSATLVHEIGHLYGVTDHYNTYYGDARDDCMWGYNHTQYNIVSRFQICDGCRAVVSANADKYTI